jgi:tRNA dimethylallyltransferase
MAPGFTMVSAIAPLDKPPVVGYIKEDEAPCELFQEMTIDPFPPLTDAWFLTGPTASGKTAVGIELAERLGAEVISVDSMTVYRGMDIGTAKPSADERAAVPHHLLDIVDPSDEFSLAEFVQRAHAAVQEIRSRGREVLLVGGTPLYLKSLLRGLYQGPPPDWEFRRAIEGEIKEVGLGALRERLEMVDPLSAQKLHPNDQRRMIRALEVFRQTGQPISHQQVQFDEAQPAGRSRVFCLSWPREELHRRIDARVERMFATGLVDEVRALLAKYGSLSRTAAQAVGYREVQEHLAGQFDLPTTIERVKHATHQFARRQETWFRGLSECRFLPQAEGKEVSATVDEMSS